MFALLNYKTLHTFLILSPTSVVAHEEVTENKRLKDLILIVTRTGVDKVKPKVWFKYSL